ncbi:hypothetical protein Adt_46861 [Abeliophyllum distichum]|uniref:Putative plant transposon protein domain-containing protein n=1 Tax=Abeliophyllum distichum TaxID=126358 RepID=A0ABD1NY17_9LAMI
MVNFNLQITDEEEERAYEMYDRGVWVSFSPDVIGHFYSVEEGSEVPAITNWNDVAFIIYPINNPRPWPHSNVVCHGDMSDELFLLHSFMAFNITLTTHLTEIYPAKMMMLYRLVTVHDLNFGEHIFNTITDFTSNSKSRSKFIFPGLISVLYKRAQVSMHSSEKDKTKTLILYFRSMRHSVDKSTTMLMSEGWQPNWRRKKKKTLRLMWMNLLSEIPQYCPREFDATVD